MFVLHETPHTSASFLADVHLRPQLLKACKIFYSCTIAAIPSIVDIKVPIYRIDGIVIPPPFQKIHPWVTWGIKDSDHLWWLIKMIWALDGELCIRFQIPQSFERLKANEIFNKKIVSHLYNPSIKVIKEWPIDNVEINQKKYAHLKEEGKIRMKWTYRDVPHFISAQPPVFKSKKCSICNDPFGCEKCDFLVN